MLLGLPSSESQGCACLKLILDSDNLCTRDLTLQTSCGIELNIHLIMAIHMTPQCAQHFAALTQRGECTDLGQGFNGYEGTALLDFSICCFCMCEYPLALFQFQDRS